MAELQVALDRLQAVASQLIQAEVKRTAAMRERDDALRAARDAGATWDMLAAAAGVSRVTISKALNRE